jgi:hypothetical protein
MSESIVNILKEVTHDTELLEKWAILLKDYVYVLPDQDIDSGSYVRYIDLRNIPLKLSNGGLISSVDDDLVRLVEYKRGNSNRRKCCWTIKRPFYLIFRRKGFTDRLLDAVQKLENKFNLAE